MAIDTRAMITITIDTNNKCHQDPQPKLTLITITVHRKHINPTNLPVPLANSTLFPGQFPNLKCMSHITIQCKSGPGQNVRGGLEDHLARFGVDPVELDAAAGFVDYVEVSFGGGRAEG